MTALLTRLRIAGFKSFAEPATVDILPGLTGIVGPNGCGKSNVVEALRWAMGETSVRSLRGGEMDDVIFAGTSARSSRNLAEVTITLQRGESALPDPFGAEEELQVTRRIERGAGSAYRGNGREMRARDVQTLFADLASGAHSSAMVSQGKVAALVNAKPEQRRQVLEEAAGITGLHARRHEAELKLRAAEANMTRAEELRTQLEQSRESLRKQARQATRFRNISSLVRTAETEFLAVQHGRAAGALAAAERAQAEASAAVAAAEAASGAAAAALEAAEAGLPGPRAAEAAARSVLERRRLEAETLNEEAARAVRVLEDAQARLAQIEADLEDAARVAADAEAAVTRLTTESRDVAARLADLPAAIAAQAELVASAEAALGQAERDADIAARLAAEAEAAAKQAQLALSAAELRYGATKAAYEGAEAAHAAAAETLISPEMLARAAAATAAADADWAEKRAGVEQAERHRANSSAAADQAAAAAERAAAQAAEAAARLRDAEDRAARTQAALDEVSAALAAAAAAQVPEADLAASRAAAAEASADDAAAELAVQAAEQARSEAAATALEKASLFDSLRAEQARLIAAAAHAASRRDSLAREAATLATQLATEEAGLVPAAILAAAEAAAQKATARAAESALAHQHALAARSEAEQTLAAARADSANAAANEARLRAQGEGLRQALSGHDDESAGLLDGLDVPPGLEAAVGGAFAHAVGALDENAASFWRTLPTLPAPAWPDGAVPFTALLQAPAAFARVLAHTVLLTEDTDGDALQPSLPAGAAIVGRDGAVWRWDGQVMRAGAPNPAASRLRQRARLRDTELALEEAAAAALCHAESQLASEAALHAALSAEATARAEQTEAESAAAEAQKYFAAVTAQAERTQGRVAALHPAIARLAAERAAADADASSAANAISALPDVPRAEEDSSNAAGAAAEAAVSLRTARANRDRARATTAAATASLQQLEKASADSESRIAALAPQQSRLAAELATATEARDAARIESANLPDANALRAAAAEAASVVRQAESALAIARDKAAAAEQTARRSAAESSRLEQAAAEARHALAARATVLAQAVSDLARDSAACDSARDSVSALPDQALLVDSVAAARQFLVACRATLTDAAALHADLANTQAALQARAHALEAERAAWTGRTAEATRRVAGLEIRRGAAADETATLREGPDELSRRAARSGAALEEAEAAHAHAAAALQAADQALRTAGLVQRDADSRAGACREAVARGEGALEAATASLAGVLERAVERLGPDAKLPEADDLSDAAEERARKKQERLIRERDEMGPVNLRADIELEEIDGKIADIDRDREELTTAIAKLRGSIGHLNREGRERLAAVFTEVDTHFRTLFTRMMGGGRAHLALVGSDDPLEAGLEIYAEPPGKKLSTLSLLSGGEQALTALSLIFAVFRCTPAPVAVLDEVDAPLDDANVDRFCSLLEDVVRDTGTRFLVVTHHQLTMSRMDRLYGVTMQERGVSRLLSVDLRRAAEMVEAAPSLQAAE